jgi:hypothetical protein
MRDVSVATKQAVLIESRDYMIPGTNNFKHKGADELLARFPGLRRRTMYRILADYRNQKAAGNNCPDLSPKRCGNCGRPSLLTPELRLMYQEISQEYADLCILLTGDLCAAELADRGVVLSASTVKRHLQLLKARK